MTRHTYTLNLSRALLPLDGKRGPIRRTRHSASGGFEPRYIRHTEVENEMTKQDKVLIFDTTLRDGEQSPGVALNVEEKLEIARALERMKVDIIEAGFPASSPGDFESVTAIAKEVRGSVIAGLARAVQDDVDACWEAVQARRARPRIHVFLSSSDIHIMHQLEKDKERVLEMARERSLAPRSTAPDVEFSPMDATRSVPEYVYRMLTEVHRRRRHDRQHPGHRRLRDSRGVRASSCATSRRTCPNIHKAVISVHCHNDLGLAVANSLAAIRAGARQIETCMNGIGERAGNASLEEVVMAIRRAPTSSASARTSTRRGSTAPAAWSRSSRA